MGKRIKFTKQIIPLIFILISSFFPVHEILIAQNQEKGVVRLIVRGDDMGVSHSVNRAIIDAYKNGIQKSVEVIVPGPWFPEAVKLLNENPGLDVGVHLALTSEWDNVKWRPLTSSPSLTDSLGYFYPFIWPHELYGDAHALISRDWSIEEIEQELRRQIEVAKATLPNVTHVSSHMGFSGMAPEVAGLVNRLAVEYGLDMDLTALGVEPMRIERDVNNTEELIRVFIQTLRELPPGDYIYVTHPDLDTHESAAMYHKGYTIERQTDYRLITSPRVQEVIEELNIQIIRYSDLKR